MPDDAGRRAAFLAAWRSHGNVRRAMRESGVGSPTTAYRWIRDAQRRPAGGPPARRTAPRIAPRIADEVIALREQQPTWGKARIAQRLAERHGRPVISATGVRSVLREAGLWAPPRIPERASGAGSVDRDWLAAELRRGIERDLRGDPSGAVAMLRESAGHLLYRRPEVVPALLREPEAGSWLLRGTLQLAHALIDTGRWASALWYLRLLDDWLRRDEGRPDARQAAWQDAGDRWLTGSDGEWRVGEAPEGAPWVSLRADEIWLETQQYLGVVLRDAPGEVAIDALVDARHVLRGRAGRRYPEARRTHLRGVIAHDLAALEQRGGYPAERVLADLDEAEALLAGGGSPSLLTMAPITRARALAASGSPADTVEAAVWDALGRVDADRPPITRAKVAIDGVGLLARMRGLDPGERERLEAAARLVIDGGLAGQARKLLGRPRLLAEVRDAEGELRRVVEGAS